MHKRVLAVLLCLAIAVSFSSAAQKKSAKKDSAGPTPDKAFMQKIWDGWSTLDPANTAQYYAPGPHTFFDVAPLKYGSWDEYKEGVKKVLAGYKAAKFTVNDDADVHRDGDLTWATATVNEDMTTKAGKRELAQLRWTVIWHNEDGKWLIVHEHVSTPME